MNIAWNKGLTKEDPRVKKYADKLRNRILTEEWKQKISEAHKGKKLTHDHSVQISKALTGRKRSKSECENISKGLQGRIFSEATKEKMRLAKIGRKHDEQWNAQIIKSWTLEKRREASLRRLKQKLPLKDTIIEKQVHKLLYDYNIAFEISYPIDLGFMIHQADIFVKPNKIIEVFGTYHHADPRKYDPDHILRVKGHNKAKDIWDYDKRIVDCLKNKSFMVLVVWQNDLKYSYDSTCSKILNFLG